MGCIDARHGLEKCVYLLKIAFLAAGGGRGGVPLFSWSQRPSVLRSRRSLRALRGLYPQSPAGLGTSGGVDLAPRAPFGLLRYLFCCL